MSSGNNILTLFSVLLSSPGFFSFSIDFDFLSGALAKVRLPPRDGGEGGGAVRCERAQNEKTRDTLREALRGVWGWGGKGRVSAF